MKRFIAVVLTIFLFIATFSGCGFNFSDLIKITPITDTTESVSTAQPSVITTTKETQSIIQTSGTTKETQATIHTTRTTKDAKTTKQETRATSKSGIQSDGVYTTKADVSLYIHTFGKLPNNFITKSQAQALGWPGGYLEPYAPGKCIGGDYFGNYEKLLPKASGRKYYECDIDTLGAKSRGPKRLVYSNDGLVYYTADHYDSFKKLY